MNVSQARKDRQTQSEDDIDDHRRACRDVLRLKQLFIYLLRDSHSLTPQSGLPGLPPVTTVVTQVSVYSNGLPS